MLFFGWNLLLNVLTPTFLQTPTSKGGYGFTPEQNAACRSTGPSTDVRTLTSDSFIRWLVRAYRSPNFRIRIQ